MAYGTEVLQRARQRLENARADQKSLQQEHLQKAYEKTPRLKEIDIQLRRSMALAAQAVFAEGGDARKAMEQVKLANLALQQEREALIMKNYAPGYLDESSICPHCDGTGYIGSTMCECLHELCRQEQKKELTHLLLNEESFDDFQLDYYPDKVDTALGVNIRAFMKKTYQHCVQYAATFSEESENLLFSGATGLGKTFLSACIARCVADKGYSVIYESATHLFSKLEKARFNGDVVAQKEAEKYTECDLLILDDLGTEMVSHFITTSLYTLINDRILSKKATIVSTNLTNEDLEKRYSHQIVSRLRGCYRRIAFLGDDIRVLKNRGV